MTTKRNELVQEVETYGNGLLADETIERTVDIIMECDPVPDSIDEIDIDFVIQAVECRIAEHLSDLYDLEYDYDTYDWYSRFYASHAYLHIGDVCRIDAESYALRYFSGREWSIRYIVRFPRSSMPSEHYSEMKAAFKRAYEYALETGNYATVLQVACTINAQGYLEDRYVIRNMFD